MLPDRIRIDVAVADASPAKGAVVRFYPVRWYTYTVTAEPQAGAATDRRGRCTVPVARIFEPEEEFGVRYCNCLVEAEYDGVKAYGWAAALRVAERPFCRAAGAYAPGCGSNAAADWCAP